ncbi:MAG: 16S rRNA (uracil(1498)-N(3))-methyltransferase [Clostridiales bacterium]|jgi:16S rRNA (uracil1498-N3)-methyltransferase|nr:16S rRNA (uracil(1498)-N(3))-methyltransferase [Clostridiales bacterium]
MPKYFVHTHDIAGDTITLMGESAAHLIVVLRARPGERVIVCDGEKTDYDCEIISITGRDSLKLKILSSAVAPEPSTEVTLYQALPKGDKLELVIQKCVELGVTRIVPIITKNASLDRLSDAKLKRYEKISEAAAKQSMRGIIPVIAVPFTFSQAITDSKYLSLTFAPYEYERHVTLKKFLSANPLEGKKSIGFFIGSEGGFASEEISQLHNADIPTVSLGKRVLRTETAGLCVLAILMYELNEMAGN